MISKYKKAVSLFEIVIVVGIFAMIAVFTTRSTFLTLRGSRKSDSQIKIKENLEYALSIVERALRNSDVVSSVCDGGNLTRIDYTDSQGAPTFFSCESVGQTSGYIASGSARLTTPDISITGCSFVCLPQEGGVPTEITINLEGKEVNSSGLESSSVTTSTKIFLRNY